MNKLIYIIILLVSKNSFGQKYNLDNRYAITIPKQTDWKISTHYCDTAHNTYQNFQLSKDLKSKERKFSKITIKYETLNAGVISDLTKSECEMGQITKIDTVNISGYKVRRLFGTNCGWSIEDWSETKIAGYSVDLIIYLGDNAFLRIMSDYFAEDKNELASIQSDLLSLINNIKLTRQ